MISDVETLVERRLCVGCGICGVVSDKTKFTNSPDQGLLLPDFKNSNQIETESQSRICPFIASNPSYISPEIEQVDASYDPLIGWYFGIFAAAVVDRELRSASSSGGLTTFLLTELLRRGEISGVLHLASSEANTENSSHFEYKISTTVQELLDARGSKYYPGSLSNLRDLLKDFSGKLAVVALPCYVRGLRLLCKEEDDFQGLFKYIFSLVCGHQKSTNFTNALAIQAGVHKKEKISHIDYRSALPEGNAHDYQTTFVNSSGLTKKTAPNKSLYAENWAFGLAMPEICTYCDDVAGENADITIGDAWIPPYDDNNLGTNIVIVRNRNLLSYFKNPDLAVDILTPNDFIQSQAGSYRNRKDGVFYRSEMKDRDKITSRVDNLKVYDVRASKEYLMRDSIHRSLRSNEYLLAKRSWMYFLIFKCKTWLPIFRYRFARQGFRTFIPSRLKNLIKILIPMSSTKPKRVPYEKNY